MRGYPTLKYFTAETGKKGEDYKGARELQGLKAWVDENLEVKCQVSTQLLNPDHLSTCWQPEPNIIRSPNLTSYQT